MERKPSSAAIAREIAGAGSANVVAGATVAATGWLWRTEIWHCPQHSREDNAGPDECPCGIPCIRRQQVALLPLQQQEAESDEANARGGIG